MVKRYSKAMLKAEATRQHIYASAMRLFYTHGYDNVSIDDIVREANSSKGTFYNYFQSKDKLFLFYNQFLEEKLADFYEKLLSNKHYTGKNAWEKLYIMIMYTLMLLRESGREFTAIADMRQLRDENGLLRQEDMLCNSANRIYLPLIAMGHQDGSIDQALDGETIKLLLYFYLKGVIYSWESSEDQAVREEQTRTGLELFFRNIAGEKAFPQIKQQDPKRND